MHVRGLLAWFPRALSSGPHIAFLAGLVGGNYANVTGDLGGCIAAGGTVHVMRLHRLIHEVHHKVHHP